MWRPSRAESGGTGQWRALRHWVTACRGPSLACAGAPSSMCALTPLMPKELVPAMGIYAQYHPQQAQSLLHWAQLSLWMRRERILRRGDVQTRTGSRSCVITRQSLHCRHSMPWLVNQCRIHGCLGRAPAARPSGRSRSAAGPCTRGITAARPRPVLSAPSFLSERQPSTALAT